MSELLDHSSLSLSQHRPSLRSLTQPNDPTTTARRSRPSGANTVNPVRIDLIGTDGIRVFIRPALNEAEFVSLVGRMEQLMDAGFDSINVVFEDTTGDTANLPGPAEVTTLAQVREHARPADQTPPGAHAGTTVSTGQ